MRPLLALVLIGSALGAQAPAPIVNTGKAPDWIQGRWVTPLLPLSLHFVGDSLEVLIIPLQGPLLSYRVKGKRVEVNSGGRDGPPADMSIRRDTLILRQNGRDMRFNRLGTGRWDSTSIAGSWLTRDGAQRSVMSFRSDDVLINESGTITDPNYRGDTLDVLMGTQVMRYVYRHSGDTLYMRGVASGSELAFVRRPWGCFNPKINKDAKECR